MANRLEHLDKFRELLKDYQISNQNKDILKQTKLVLVVGPSSVGRNTIIGQLLKTGHYSFIISDTTRRPRENNGVSEQDGREYWFRSEAEILQEIKDGDFLEFAIIHEQQVSGISMRELIKAQASEKTAITDVEVVGAAKIHDLKPDTIFIFVLPPSLEELLSRLHKRGTLPEAEVNRRLHSAYNELSAAVSHDYYQFVVNKTVEEAEKQIQEIVDNGKQLSGLNNSGRQVAENLIKELSKELNTYPSLAVLTGEC